MKPLLVSVWYRGQRWSVFTRMAPDSDGKFRLSPHELSELLWLTYGFRISPHTAFSLS